MPISRNLATLCCVGLVLSSPAAFKNGMSVTWMNTTLPGPASSANWRIASRNGSPSMSPVVPPISVINTSTSLPASRMRALISLVTCGNHLHGLAQVIAAALLLDHRLVHLTGGEVVEARQLAGGEPLVVAEIEIGFGAVLQHIDFAVLKGAHRPRVDVEVGIELLDPHHLPALLEQRAERGGGESLAQGRDHAAGDKNVFHRRLLHRAKIA